MFSFYVPKYVINCRKDVYNLIKRVFIEHGCLKKTLLKINEGLFDVHELNKSKYTKIR